MSSSLKSIEEIKERFTNVSFCLNERSRRIWCASEARVFGRGGIKTVFRATGVAESTIRSGLKELDNEDRLSGKFIRKRGAGRKKHQSKYSNLVTDLESLIEPFTRGDPESPLLWTCKSTYKLAETLKKKGYAICQRTVCNLLSTLDYSLQSNKKTKEGGNHPDRNAQFEHINHEVKSFQERSCPTISVDTKKKESIGNYKNNGREYSKKGKPQEVNGHDFPDKELGKVAPYGVYDIGENKGWVSVGISNDTAEFAVNSIKSWWYEMGKPLYAKSDEILVTADCGGSNGYRTRLWKLELQKLANEIKKTINVCHFPPGTSKWNKIEHRMFSYITKNWRGKPLITRETVVNLIGNTRTKKGFEIKVKLDENKYQKGIKVTDEEFNKINIEKAEFHGEWNYKIKPKRE